jgi:mono/diheme cytochrome c family protein
MKKVFLIGLLITGIIFQNCKNNKTQPAVISNGDTETVVEKKGEPIKIKDTVEIEEESAISVTEPTKVTLKKEVFAKTVDKETAEEVVEKVAEKEKEIIKEAEPVVKKEVEETVTEPVIEKAEETKTVKEPIIEEIKTVANSNKWQVPAKYQTMKNPTNPKDDVAIGKSLYSKHCKSCHGSEGYGDGPKADEMTGDLGDFSTEEFQTQSDGELFYKTTFGRADMPEYTKKIPDDEDRWLLVNYMRTLAE